MPSAFKFWFGGRHNRRYNDCRDRLTHRFWARIRAFVANHSQIIAVLAFRQLVDNFGQIRLRDEAHAQRDLLETGNLESLPMFDGGNVVTRFQQAGLGAGVEPGHAAAEQFHVQRFLFEVEQIEICDFKFAACRWTQAPAKIDNLLVVNIETGHGKMTFRLFRFFFETNSTSIRAELHHAVTLRITHLITENATAAFDRQGLPVKVKFPVENVVA